MTAMWVKELIFLGSLISSCKIEVKLFFEELFHQESLADASSSIDCYEFRFVGFIVILQRFLLFLASYYFL